MRRIFAGLLLAIALASMPAGQLQASHDGEPCALCDAGHEQGLRDAIYHHWIPTFFYMAHQLSLNMIHQAVLIGPFLDAKYQMETQLLMQGLNAEAHKDYQPSEQMCRFGTGIKSLFPAEVTWRENARVMSVIFSPRERLSADNVSSAGPDIDKRSRMEQFQRLYCDKRDNNDNLNVVCRGNQPASRINRDIDFIRTVEARYTLDLDFINTATSVDEEDIVALTRNLFSYDTLSEIPERHVDEVYAQDEIQDMRSLTAMRSVIYNSFGHIVGMRAQGSANQNVAPFMRNLIAETGVPANEIDEFLGTNPSYFAQMEVLTRKMYETPEFYSGLYTTPANVKRTGVALKAIDLMQDRDRFEAALRREVILSLILEMKLREAQGPLNRDILDNNAASIFTGPL